MIQNTKCECGHQNHIGTVLCESCGKPLYDLEGTTPLEMRYDGVARRSQKENPGIIDQVWNFFSSVKIAIYLIIITLLGSAIGTIYPQENVLLNTDPSIYYPKVYGTAGHIYYLLGFSHTYNSWWFVTLLFMIGTSLIVCSLDRVLPLYRALSRQKIEKHPNFILRQRISYQNASVLDTENENIKNTQQWMTQLTASLKKRRYRVHVDENGTALLAEKNRFSRWGPYINHIGLIIFLCGALMRSIPGWYMDQYVGFLEGEPKQIPHTQYYVMNEAFKLDRYTNADISRGISKDTVGMPKLYETKAVLYKCVENCNSGIGKPVLKELTKQTVQVNHPLMYKDIKLYQFDYRFTPQIISVLVTLQNKQTKKDIGQFKLEMIDPKDHYTVGPYDLTLKDYYPDFTLDDQGLPTTKSNDPKAPAFVFRIKGPNLPSSGNLFMYFPRPMDKAKYHQDQINGKMGNVLDISAKSMSDVKIAQYTSFLNVRVDKAMPFIWIGAAISMLGLILGFYWQHRRIWMRLDGNQLSLGAHTNKNWYGIRQEVAQSLQQTGLVVNSKSLDKGVKE